MRRYSLNPLHGRAAFAAPAGLFLLGAVLGATLKSSIPQVTAATPAAQTETGAPGAAAPLPAGSLSRRLDRGLVYPAEVIRVLDGDTFQARVRVWPGIDVDTRVRLRGIDAAELHARCSEEYARAVAARGALETILAEGDVAISQVGTDKYGGRVDAAVSTIKTADVSAAMLRGGWARTYGGGRRESWCG